jgi:rfaE bifunctional protein kinase chain/domain
MSLTRENIIELFNRFNNLNVLIIGDVMIDSYYWGSVNRISPEAPVPVVAVNKKEYRLGGAANVALNIQALGGTPHLCSVIGDEIDADILTSLLEKQNMSGDGIIRSKDRITTVKTRVIGNNHQMIRVDSETDKNIDSTLTEKLFSKISEILDAKKIDVVIFEDYDKGVITPALIEKVVNLAKQKNIPTTVDPKKRNFLDYKNVTLFKPNLKELCEGLKIEIEKNNISEVEKGIDELEKILHSKISFITLSENGVFIKDNQSKHHIKAHIRDIADVSGAGDTVISVASMILACEQPLEVIAELSNLAGGLVCEKVGVVPIQKEDLLKEALEKLAK